MTVVVTNHYAGGTGGTDETGTNTDAHQMSVIWNGDARSTCLHIVFNCCSENFREHFPCFSCNSNSPTLASEDT